MFVQQVLFYNIKEVMFIPTKVNMIAKQYTIISRSVNFVHTLVFISK